MSVYKMFATDEESEVNGVKFVYDDEWFMLARAGGKNTAFVNLLRQRLASLEGSGFRSQVSPAVMKKREEVTVETFIETCLRGWGSKVHGDGYITGPDGEKLAFSKAAAAKLFEDLPDLLADLINCANGVSAYRRDIQETDEGN